MSACYDRFGQPITIEEWSALFNAPPSDRTLGFTHVGEYRVSTVWLGMDHGYGEGPPLIFETMTFGGDKDCEVYARYSTEAEALAGHQVCCDELAAFLGGGA